MYRDFNDSDILLDSLADEDLCREAANGSRRAEEILVTRYHRLVRVCARPFFLVGGDSEDLIQEGMIGLLRAVYGYSSSGGAEFTTYSVKCISNCIIDAVRNQLRNKHTPLNSYVLIDSIDLVDGQANPQAVIEMQESMSQLRDKIRNKLSELEQEVLRLHILGLDYDSIAEKLSVSNKTVDNALQRARKKLKEK